VVRGPLEWIFDPAPPVFDHASNPNPTPVMDHASDSVSDSVSDTIHDPARDIDLGRFPVSVHDKVRNGLKQRALIIVDPRM
jgi:hypothetical protein